MAHWEVTLQALKTPTGTLLFKVTRRLPVLAVAETRIFRTQAEAQAQFEAWLE
jgi:hypothetical protein